MSSPPPQTFVKGSRWPAWGDDAWVELAFLRLAVPRDGFPVVNHAEYKGGRSFHNPSVYECDDPPPSTECCTYRVVAAIEARTGELVTVEANLEHNHPPCEDPDERERLREKAREAIHSTEVELCNSATTELERLFRRAGFRTGFEEEEKGGVPAHEEQQSVIWDLKIALGEELAREVEDKARAAWMLVEGYATPLSTAQLHWPYNQPTMSNFPSTSSRHEVEKAGKSSLDSLKSPSSKRKETDSRAMSTGPRKKVQQSSTQRPAAARSSTSSEEDHSDASAVTPPAKATLPHKGSKPFTPKSGVSHPRRNQSETFNLDEGSGSGAPAHPDRVERSLSLHGPDPPRFNDSTVVADARQTPSRSHRSSRSPSSTSSSSDPRSSDPDPRLKTTMSQPTTTIPEATTSHVPSSPLTLLEYLRTLDGTGAFDFSSLEPYFIKNGVRTPLQLETYARGHWSSLMSRVEHESGLGAMEREVLGSCLEEKLGVSEEDKEDPMKQGG